MQKASGYYMSYGNTLQPAARAIKGSTEVTESAQAIDQRNRDEGDRLEFTTNLEITLKISITRVKTFPM